MDKEKYILRVQPIYTILICLITFILLIILIFLPSWMNWEDTESLWGYIWYSSMTLFSLYFFGLFLYNLQYAIVDDKGIKIKSLFYVIAYIEWKEIHEILKKDLVTHDSRGAMVFCWLIIKVNKKDAIRRVGINRRNMPPWQIIGSKRNIEIIEKYHDIKKIK